MMKAMGRAGALVVGALLLGAAATASGASGAAVSCRVPNLVHLRLSVAKHRAADAGCTLRLAGARVQKAELQTVDRQSPARGRHASSITLWINPLCNGMGAEGPRGAEPRVTPGPTELISGFFLNGGPHRFYSSRGCRRAAPSPEAGTVRVLNPASGAVVATGASRDGQFVKIALPAGTYSIIGTFADAIVNGRYATRSLSVQVPAGHTVRQDFILQIP
jgi:hypothetical protein